MDLYRADVEGIERFVLELVVIDDGAIAGHDLGDRVREVRAFAEERFDDGDLASAAGHDQVAVMRHDRMAGVTASDV